MKQLYYIRHGQSVVNAQSIWGGQLDSPLTEQGLQEAHDAAKKAADESFMPDLILTTQLERAFVTAQIIAEAIGYPKEKIVIDARLLERNFGDLEGKPVTDIVMDYSRDYHKLDDIPSVEKLEDLQKRAQAALKKITSMPQDTILIVGHAAFGRALRRVIAGPPYTDEYTAGFKQIPNAQLFKLIG